MSFAPARSLLLALAVVCTACGSEVILDDDPGASSASSAPDRPGDDGEAGGVPVPATGTGQWPTTSTGAGEGGADGDGGAGAGEGGSGGGGLGGAAPVSDICALTAQIAMAGIGLDVDAWRPGESATLSATLSTPVDHFSYPGLRLTSDTPGVTPAEQEQVLFGLAAGQPALLQGVIGADPTMPPGTVVTLRLEVFTLVEECEGAAEATFEVTLQ